MSKEADIRSDNDSSEKEVLTNDSGMSACLILNDSVFFKMTCEISELLAKGSQEPKVIEQMIRIIKRDTGLDFVALNRINDFDITALSVTSIGISTNSIQFKMICPAEETEEFMNSGEGQLMDGGRIYRMLRSAADSEETSTDAYGSIWIADLEEYNSEKSSDVIIKVCGEDPEDRFKSLGLIPVRENNTEIGLLILSDCRKGVFTQKNVARFEKLARVIALGQKEGFSKTPMMDNSYKELFNDLSEFLLKLDVFGNIRFISENITRYCNVVPEDIQGMNIYAHDLLGIDRNLWVGMIESTVLKKEVSEKEILIKTIKGNVTFQVKLVPQQNMDGDVELLELVFKDVTENKELERVLAEKENLFYNALDSSMSGVVVVDAPSNQIIYCNEVALKFGKNFTGSAKDNRSISGYFHGVDCLDMKGNIFDVSDEAFSGLFRQKRKICKHLKLSNNYNESVVLNFSFTPIENLHGEITAGIIVFINITDIITLKSQRDEFLDKFSTLFNIIPDTVAIAQFSDGKILNVNDSCYKMFGISRVEAVGCTIAELGICISPDLLSDFFNPVKNGRAIADTVVKLRRKSGEEFFATIHAQGMYYSGVYCIMILVRDITDIIRMNEEIKQSEKMSAIGQLVGGVAHDFNNQLTGILGYSDYLVSNLDDPDLKRYAESIATCAVRSADLTEKLLDFSRRGEGKKELLDIQEIIQDVINMLEHSIDKKISIRKIFNAEVTTCIGDFSQLQNALLNLGINARDAISEDAGMISFITSSVSLDNNYCVRSKYDILPGDYISIKVRDTGYGMNEEIISKIFEPFFTTKEPGRGTGMGLAAVWNTIQQHKGAIEVVSSIGQGTTFEILLPEKPAEGVTRKVSVGSMGKGLAMLVDDEEIVRIMGEQMLLELGYEVILCSNGSEAVQVFRERAKEIDVVILDMIMSKMSGREAFINMKNIDEDVTVIITTGYARGQDISEVLNMGAAEVLKKPFYIEDLARVIKDSVEG